MNNKASYNFLKILVPAVLIAGAAVSLAFMFAAGRNQRSILLILLFTFWVLSPFAGLMAAHLISKNWLKITRTTLYCLVLFITIGSLVSYSGAFNPPGTKPAFKFLVVPFLSWVIMLIIIPFVASASRKSLRKQNNSTKD